MLFYITSNLFCIRKTDYPNVIILVHTMIIKHPILTVISDSYVQLGIWCIVWTTSIDIVCCTNFHCGEKAKAMRLTLFTNISH